MFDDAGDDRQFRRVLLVYGCDGTQAQYSIYLDYPFPFSALEEEADRAELTFRSVIHASSLTATGATLGEPGGEDDLTPNSPSGTWVASPSPSWSRSWRVRGSASSATWATAQTAMTSTPGTRRQMHDR